MSLASVLEFARKKKGLSLRKVETLTGISNAYIHQLEKSKRRPPRPQILAKLAEVYEVSLMELMEKAGYLSSEDDLGRELAQFIRDDSEALGLFRIFFQLSTSKKNDLIKYAEYLSATDDASEQTTKAAEKAMLFSMQITKDAMKPPKR